MQPFTFSPLIAQLASSRRILLAGCGGGSDVFGALPIYFGLQRAFAAMMAGSSSGDAPEIFLASLTSADEKDVIKHPSKRHGDNLIEVRYSAIVGDIAPLSDTELAAACSKWTLASHLASTGYKPAVTAGSGVILVEPICTPSQAASGPLGSAAISVGAPTVTNSIYTNGTTVSSSSSTPSSSSSSSVDDTKTASAAPFVDPFHGIYFQEHRLSKWFAECRGRDVPIYTIPTTRGTMGVTDGYATLCKLLNIDSIILVDVGIDSLCFGREEDLGTPVEDMMSLAAIAQMPSSQVHTKILTCFGVGLEPCGEINFFHNLSVLQNEGAFLGTICLVPQMPEAIAYCQVVRFCGSSTLNGTLSASLEGKFGRQLVLPTGQEVNEYDCFAQPLAQLYWFFDLHAVSRRVEYLHCIIGCHTSLDVRHAIAGWRTRERLQDGKRQGSKYCGPHTNVKINFRHPVCTHNGPVSSSPSSGHHHHRHHHDHDPASEVDEDPMPRAIASPPGAPLPMVKFPSPPPVPAATAVVTATSPAPATAAAVAISSSSSSSSTASTTSSSLPSSNS